MLSLPPKYQVLLDSQHKRFFFLWALSKNTLWIHSRYVSQTEQVADMVSLPLLFPSGPRRMVHSSMMPKASNRRRTSSSHCCLFSMPTNSFLSSEREKEWKQSWAWKYSRTAASFKRRSVSAVKEHKVLHKDTRSSKCWPKQWEISLETLYWLESVITSQRVKANQFINQYADVWWYTLISILIELGCFCLLFDSFFFLLEPPH